MSALSLSSVLLLFLASSGVDAFYGFGVMRCHGTSRDGHDAVFTEELYFNKIFLALYNSSLGKFIGNTKKAKEFADSFNKNPTFMERERMNTERYCKNLIPAIYNSFDNTAEPYVRLRSVEAASSRHPAMLVCSVYDFYPKPIRVTWLRDGKEVTSDVTSTVELSDGNWLYQIHSHLEYTPAPGEKITCMVEHASLSEPKLQDWDPVPESQRNKFAIGGAGLLLGLVFLAAGLISYKKSSTGRMLVPTS
ncbi:H-2 class II histocompatibility antigen, E-S beta chain-like [Centroberyx gerrardi]